MDYRDHIALIRAGADGPERFCAAASGRPDLDPRELFAFAAAQQLRPWLAYCASGSGARDLLPAWLLDELDGVRTDNAARVERLARQSRELREAFETAGIGCLFLKGLTVGARLYGDPVRRAQGDVDLLVDRGEFRRAVERLGQLGYDASVHVSTGEPLAARVDAALGEGSGRKLRNSCTLQRGPRERVDLHWCIRTYYARATAGERLWRDRCSVEVGGGAALPTLSLENVLLVLLLNIAADLRSSRCRAKLFLDLYLACRAWSAAGSWDDFLSSRRKDGVEPLAVNVLALLLSLWRCGAEFPELRDALLRRAHRIETPTPEDAAALVARPREDAANRRWHARIHQPTRTGGVWFRVAKDPTHSFARLLRPRRGAALLEDPAHPGGA